MRRFGWLAPVAVILGLGGCATGAGSGPSPAGPSTEPPSASACASSLDLNDTDNGKTACVTRGGTVTVSLTGAAGQEWASPQTSPAGVLTAAALSYSAPPYTMARAFNAVAAGTAQIMSSRSACPPPSPGSVACHALVSFRVTVTVR
jgi:hypothetical protein